MKLSNYYKGYLELHKHPKTRLLHFIGQWVTLFFIGFVFYNWYWYLIPLIPFVIYPFAWSGHYFFEKNKPAAFKNPWLAKLSDWRMFLEISTGKIKLF